MAVRGVFPLHDQIEALAHAMGNPSAADRQRLFSLVKFKEFQLWRQTAQPGPDPWDEAKAPWELVDQQPVINLLRNEIAGWAPERVFNGR